MSIVISIINDRKIYQILDSHLMDCVFQLVCQFTNNTSQNVEKMSQSH